MLTLAKFLIYFPFLIILSWSVCYIHYPIVLPKFLTKRKKFLLGSSLLLESQVLSKLSLQLSICDLHKFPNYSLKLLLKQYRINMSNMHVQYNVLLVICKMCSAGLNFVITCSFSVPEGEVLLFVRLSYTMQYEGMTIIYSSNPSASASAQSLKS